MLDQKHLYKAAFHDYLRKGTSIKQSLTQYRNSTHYIWRTRLDGKVRSSHRANHGKKFAWNNPPSTGHPGEDFNCRCWAEPVLPARRAEVTKHRSETLIAGPFGHWGQWVDVYSLSDSTASPDETGRVNHTIEMTFNLLGEAPSTFEVEIVGLGQRHLVIGPGSHTIGHAYTLEPEAYFAPLPDKPFDGKLKARAKSHALTLRIDAAITYN